MNHLNSEFKNTTLPRPEGDIRLFSGAKNPLLFDKLGEGEMTRLHEYICRKTKKGVVMIDLDRNLTDDQYNFTDLAGMREAIRKVQDEGNYMVCLNSSRSLAFLKVKQKELGITGPIFAESGNMIYVPELGMEIIFSERATDYFGRLKTRLDDELEERLGKKGYKNVAVRFLPKETAQNTITSLKENGSAPDLTNPYVVSIHEEPEQKISMLAYKNNQDGPDRDDLFLNSVRETLKEFETETPYTINNFKSPLTYGFWPQDGAILVHLNRQNKTPVWRTLLNFMGDDTEEKRFFHLGDGYEDYIRDERVKILAPSNIKDSLRPYASRISDFSYTVGVIDNIKWIITSEKNPDRSI